MQLTGPPGQNHTLDLERTLSDIIVLTMETELTIQQAADRTGLGVHTLRYYERIGLISPVDRASNGHRRYSEDDIGWIIFLMRLRSTGMPISTMKQYADLQRQGDATSAERLALLKEHRRTVKQRIQELTEYLEVIEHKIDYYSEMVSSAVEDACAVA
jgi:DNA-binding transcriptional MerR regulator